MLFVILALLVLFTEHSFNWFSDPWWITGCNSGHSGIYGHLIGYEVGDNIKKNF